MIAASQTAASVSTGIIKTWKAYASGGQVEAPGNLIMNDPGLTFLRPGSFATGILNPLSRHPGEVS
ncbi:hypothetical protein DSLASN_06720 [Desulfoluna limicola]|uniref:Uncharacterized protein n=1 Tax=Desulfoluna limicola TaxID=2810562 RepID=A0ABN6F0A0_9BACT|nr:hypothetical protein DSLASN_06720 [Desulfoluna limicola]